MRRNWITRLKDAVRYEQLKLIRWSKGVSLPGFKGIPLYHIVRIFIKELEQDSINVRSKAVAFSFFLSLFPLLIFLLPILYSTPYATFFLHNLKQAIRDIFPLNAQEYLFNIIDGVQQQGNYNLLSISFFMALVFSSSGMLTIMDGFDKSNRQAFKKRSALKKIFIAIGLTIILTLLVVLSVVLIFLGGNLINYLSDYFSFHTFETLTLNILRWVLTIMVYYVTLTIIYRYGSSMRKPLRFINPGSVIATFLSIFSSILFSIFINNFGRYNQIYGSIGALIVLLLWIQLNAFFLLIGFEINASVAINDSRNDDEKEY